MNYSKLTITLLLILFTSYTFAQKKLLGKVKNFNGDAISSAIVYVDGAKTNIKTNARGYFEIELTEKTTSISILSPDYGLLTAEYKDQESLSFVYVNESYKKVSSNNQSENEVSIGYGKVDEKNSTYGTANIKYNKGDHTYAFNTIYDLIRARLKGVVVSRSNRVVIRGFSGANPLFVVNGMIVDDISYIRPVEVKEMNVLKGAASSMYGTRAAGGVIEITLKGN